MPKSPDNDETRDFTPATEKFGKAMCSVILGEMAGVQPRPCSATDVSPENGQAANLSRSSLKPAQPPRDEHSSPQLPYVYADADAPDAGADADAPKTCV